MAQAVVEERHLIKTLRWWDGFVLALANPGFLLGSLGWTVLDLGGWGAVFLWGLTAALIVPVMVLYSELAAMSAGRSFSRSSGSSSVTSRRRRGSRTSRTEPMHLEAQSSTRVISAPARSTSGFSTSSL